MSKSHIFYGVKTSSSVKMHVLAAKLSTMKAKLPPATKKGTAGVMER